jgi:N-acetylneuraminic acid mutarotase
MPYPAQAGEGFAVQDRYFVALGGDRDIERWNMFVALEGERGKAEKGSAQWQQANTAITFMQDHHTGFNQGILVYDTKTRTWAESGFLPAAGPVTTQPVSWKGELLLVSGEVAPGKRTPKIWAGLPVKK